MNEFMMIEYVFIDALIDHLWNTFKETVYMPNTLLTTLKSTLKTKLSHFPPKESI